MAAAGIAAGLYWTSSRMDAAIVSTAEPASAPALTLLGPADQTLTCLETPVFGAPQVSGACAPPPRVTWVDAAAPGPCPQSWTITRTWTAQDACSNVASCRQVITVRDEAPPWLATPPDVTLSCQEVPGPDISGGAVALDACDPNPRVRYTDQVETLGCPGARRVTRTWIAEDACGNQASRVQRITLRDEEPPQLTCPADQTVECGASVEPGATGRATATDRCSGVATLTYADAEQPPACTGTRVILRTWTAVDGCGNRTTGEQHLTLLDRTAPVIVCPPDATVSCDAGLAETGIATATDTCDPAPQVDFADREQPGQGAEPPAIRRRWTARDACGNVAECVQTITRVDGVPPLLACPPDQTLACGQPTDPGATGWARATDVCDPVVTLEWADAVTTGRCAGEQAIVRRWTARDRAGRASACEQRIVVRDTTAPDVVCPADLTVSCDAVPAPDPASVRAAETCSGPATVQWVGDTATDQTCPGRYVRLRTYRATDACGNTSTCVQRLVVDDRTPPQLTCRPDRVVECGAPWGFDDPAASDPCPGPVTITVAGTLTNATQGAGLTAVRTWRAVDACGNAAECRQTIRVVDTTAPIMRCPTEVAVSCADADGAAVRFTATAQDACDPAASVVCSPPSGSTFPVGRSRVTCTGVDASGNAGSCQFQVTVADPEPPVLVCAPDLVASEDSPGVATAVVRFETPAARDGCDRTPRVECRPPSGGRFPTGATVVTCTATDASGNHQACAFTVRIIPFTIVVDRTDDAGPGTLRQALLDANAGPGPNAIAFAFPGPGPFTIALQSPLPPITEAARIDGWSQVGFSGRPLVQLDGSAAGAVLTAAQASPAAIGSSAVPGVTGLSLLSGSNVVRGLALFGFETGLRVAGPGGNVIEGNFIGTDTTGALALGNTGDGLVVTSPCNRIGSSLRGAGNVIVSNGGRGLYLTGRLAVSNRVEGNFIGTSTAELPGSLALGNGTDGVALGSSAAHNWIGGIEPAAGNWIAFNRGSGVVLEPTAGTANTVVGNSIYANGGLGIDLGGDGLSPNDPGDADAGPNGLVNAPELEQVVAGRESVLVRGRVNGEANQAYRLEFFVNASVEGSADPEGQQAIGSATVATDASGTGWFALEWPDRVDPDEWITATVTDAEGNTSEFSSPLKAATPPFIMAGPENTRVAPGQPATFCVEAGGSEPLTYQWRRNGVNLAGATNLCHTIPAAQLTDGGSYTVVVRNDYGAVVSSAAVLSLELTVLQASDPFSQGVALTGSNGRVSGSNLGATKELGEPNFAGKLGGRSVWYTWRAPATGIATFVTSGSSFDTLLGAYTGSAVSNLTLVVSDEDRGGFYTSGIRFNVIGGTEYHIAIDGFGGAGGQFVLQWDLEATTQFLPQIRRQPVGLTVPPGAPATFSVEAVPVCKYTYYKNGKYADRCRCGHVLTYQWFFRGAPLAGATNAVLTRSAVGPGDVGNYSVRVAEGTRAVDSVVVSLQLNETGGSFQDVQATDKFLDAVLEPRPLRLGGPPGPAPGFSLVSGYTGTHVFDSTGSATELDEEPICGVVGGASQWIPFVTTESGSLFLSTEGSSFDTVMAVLRRSAANPALLEVLACNNDSGAAGGASALMLPVQAGQTNYVVVDGVNGATGILRLNYSLVTPGRLKVLGKTTTGDNWLRLEGHAAMRFTIQGSSNLVTWTPLLTSNSPVAAFEFIDRVPKESPPRFYRAVMLP